VIGLASERAWAMAAVLAAMLLAIGLVLRRRAGTWHLAGVLMTPAAAVALLALVPLYLGARDLRLTRQAGVVVVRETPMTDDNGARLEGEAIPEAAKLELGERRGQLIHARYGTMEGWIAADAVRVLRTR
jgi:hypothetical protein